LWLVELRQWKLTSKSKPPVTELDEGTVEPRLVSGVPTSQEKEPDQ
jgi:hypothetical protein